MDFETVKEFAQCGQAAQAAVNDIVSRRSEAEINDLKAQWLADPCWDIEYTEGFEAHSKELEEFHKQHSRQWDLEYKERQLERCTRYGCSPKLLIYIESLEARIDVLTSQLEKIRNSV